MNNDVFKVVRLVHASDFRKFLHTSRFNLKKRPLKPSPKNFKKFPVQGSIQYVARQLSDPYVKKRSQEGYRCRSVYKLKEMNSQYQFLKPGMSVIDLGAAPGSWSQVAAEEIFYHNDTEMNEEIATGQVIAVDIQHFSPLDKVSRVVGDFTEIDTQKKIVNLLHGTRADAVLCDAAPKASGHDCVDHILIVKLAASAAQFAFFALKPGGTFLCKVWECPEAFQLKENLKKFFKVVKRVKPPASRLDSLEFYILCQNYFVKKKPI